MMPELVDTIEKLQKYIDAIDAQQEKSIYIQKLAIMARKGPEQQAEAKRLLQQLDRQPHVVDAGSYYDAIKDAIKLLKNIK